MAIRRVIESRRAPRTSSTGRLRSLLRRFQSSALLPGSCPHQELVAVPDQLPPRMRDINQAAFACSACGEMFSDLEAMLMQHTEAKRRRARGVDQGGLARPRSVIL